MASSSSPPTAMANAMTSDSLTDFDAAFAALTGKPPFPWQRRLYGEMCCGEFRGLDLPTGLGKTSAVVCWLIALAGHRELPRRLVYVVNRRTIVDQVTDVAKQLYETLRDSADPAVVDLRQRLQGVAGGEGNGVPLAISTLRGEFADNGAWRRDPARPAIIVGTPDLIGSDLLFAGYRTGRRSQTLHTGLLGHDALVLHDEAHLSEPFQVLLESIQGMQGAAKTPHRPIRVMPLSATGGGTGADRLKLDEADFSDTTVAQRYHAAKWLRLHDLDNPKALATRLAELALEYKSAGVRVIVYARRPDDAAAVVKLLLKDKSTKPERVALLTGRIRGKERDDLAKGPVLTALRTSQAVGQTHYLVATSAGEVGADFDADHLVCDLTTADALVQRLGRVNRRGNRSDTRVDLVAVDEPAGKNELAITTARREARAATLALLRGLPKNEDGLIDASPRATRELWHAGDKHRDPAAEVLPLTPQMVDALSLTSVEAKKWPLLPDVATLIHGFVDDLPEATLAWRAEVPLILEHRRQAEDVESATRDVLAAAPVLSAERLTVPADAAAQFWKDRAKSLAAALKPDDAKEPYALLYDRDGVRRVSLADDLDPRDLASKTLLLPPGFGGLKNGTLDAKEGPPNEGSLDVADRCKDDGTADAEDDRTRRRFRLHEFADGWECRPPPRPGDDPAERRTRGEWLDAIKRLGFNRHKDISFRLAEESQHGLDLVIATVRKPTKYEKNQPTVEQHNTDVAGDVRRITAALGLAGDLADALVAAGRHHDDGKRRPALAVVHRQPRSERGLRQIPRRPAARLAGSRGLSPRVRLARRRDQGRREGRPDAARHRRPPRPRPPALRQRLRPARTGNAARRSDGLRRGGALRPPSAKVRPVGSGVAGGAAASRRPPRERG